MGTSRSVLSEAEDPQGPRKTHMCTVGTPFIITDHKSVDFVPLESQLILK